MKDNKTYNSTHQNKRPNKKNFRGNLRDPSANSHDFFPSANSHDFFPSANSHDFFPSVKRTRSYAILKAEKDFTFHIWTRPSSFYHSHENYIEIFIVTEGKLIHHFNKQQTVMKTGDAFIVFPGQYHKHSPYKNYPSQHINLTCNPDFANNLLKLYFNSDAPLCAKQLVHLNTNAFQTALNYQKIILESPDEFSQNVFLKAFISFIIGLFYIGEDRTEMPDWLKDFIRKLNNVNLSNDFKISEIYNVSNYSQTTLCREFKKYTGKTLVSYINDLKLNYACNLLKNTTFPLWSIANTVGFSSQAHFTRLFKERYGITPLQFRKN